MALTPRPAGAQLVLGAEARAQAASNPLLLPGPDRDALLAEVSVRPEYRTTSETGDRLDVAGVLTARTFSRLYRDYLLGSLRATGTWRDSERLTATATAGYLRDLAGDTLATSVEAALAPQSVRNVWQAGANLTWRPDARTMVKPLIDAERADYSDSVVLRDTGSARIEVAVMRLLSARTWVGVRPLMVVSRTGGQPDLHRVAAFASLDAQLAPHWHLQADVGPEHVDGAPATALTARRHPATAFSGSLALCREQSRSTLCLNASLGSDISALAGFQRRLAAGVALNRRADERWTVVAQADYQRLQAAEATIAILARDLTAAAVLLRLDWRASRQATVSGEISYAQRSTEIGSKPRSTYAGIRLRWEPRL
jgi:hypothetical protein